MTNTIVNLPWKHVDEIVPEAEKYIIAMREGSEIVVRYNFGKLFGISREWDVAVRKIFHEDDVTHWVYTSVIKPVST